jgi:hypothetical protein
MAKSRRYKERQINSTRPTGRARGLPSKNLPMRVELTIVCKWRPYSGPRLHPLRLVLSCPAAQTHPSHQSHLCRDLLTTMMINITPGALDSLQLAGLLYLCSYQFLDGQRMPRWLRGTAESGYRDAITQLKNLNIERRLLFAFCSYWEFF